MRSGGIGPAIRPLTPAERERLPLSVKRSQRFAVGYALAEIVSLALFVFALFQIGLLTGRGGPWWTGLLFGISLLAALQFSFILVFQVHTTGVYRTQVQMVLMEERVHELVGIARVATRRGRWVTVRSIMVGDEKLSLDSDGIEFDFGPARTYRRVQDGSPLRLAFVLARDYREDLAVGWLLSVNDEMLPTPQRITWETTAELEPPSPPLLDGEAATAAASGKAVLSIERVGTGFDREAPGHRFVSLGGTLGSGTLRTGDMVRISPGPGSSSAAREVKIHRIFPERGGRFIESASAGQRVQIAVWGIDPRDVRAGDRLLGTS